MNTHVAFLRAINVGGHVVKMERLRQLFAELGLRHVRSYLNSGNLSFRSQLAAASLEQKIAAHLQGALGYPVDTFVRSLNELAAVCTHFGERKGQVAFFHRAPGPDAQQAFVATYPDQDFHFESSELYWFLDGPMTATKVQWNRAEKQLGASTMRNINTLRRVLDALR